MKALKMPSRSIRWQYGAEVRFNVVILCGLPKKNKFDKGGMSPSLSLLRSNVDLFLRKGGVGLRPVSMATRGRKPKPTGLKVLEGNPGKRALNPNEPKPVRKAPSCPKWLDKEAKKEWKRLAPKLEAMGLLCEVDMAAFAGYCQSYARWKENEEFITEHGSLVRTPSGYWMQVPQVSMAQQYMKQMKAFAAEFGLTPSSRSRLIADSMEASKKDDMEMLLDDDAEPERKIFDA